MAPSVWDDAVQATLPHVWWKFDEASGSTAFADSSGNGKHCPVTPAEVTLGRPSLIPGSPDGKAWQWQTQNTPAGVSGVGYYYANHTKAVTYRAISGAVSTRFFYDGVNHWLELHSGSASVKVNWDTYSFKIPGTGTGYAPSSASLFNGQPHFVLCRVGSTRADLIIDGAFVAEALYPLRNNPNNTVSTVYPVHQYRFGEYDDMLMWNQQLTDAEIASLWDGWQGLSAAPVTESSTTFISMVNVGAAPTPKGDATLLSTLNVGLEQPPVLNIHHPQIGWGTPLIPSREITLIPKDAQAVAYNYENVVE